MDIKKSKEQIKYNENSLTLAKKPKGVTIIEGFPGYGLVATISTGFLLDHLKCEKIGSYHFEQAMPTLAIHECKLVDPIGIYYNKPYNLVIVHAVTSVIGLEWQAAELIMDLYKKLQAKEIISIEGVGSQSSGELKAFYFTTNPSLKKKIEKLGYSCIGEGIIVGVTSALLLKQQIPHMCVFAETRMKLPDSKAAAKVIESLDKYLGLKVDYKPLLKQAEEFEKKLKGLLEQSQKAQKKTIDDKKKLSYIA
ncbi:proteasome assembly chaperone family protein [Candidatus Woesearchaeota archaeon]|nr:proteasome assembly chaperone family protein [Candidatus Woesearchaeota archaeon]